MSFSEKKTKYALQAFDVIPECCAPDLASQIFLIICSFSSNRGEPATDEQGLPASAAGCQAVLTAVPSW